ncbi:MAG: hypothetical protein AAGE98_10595 [Actinomycetota bacterium]
MRTGSFRWWFEDRTTGRITIAQFPNPPLWVGFAGWIVDLIFGGALGTIGRLVSIAGFVWWGVDELVRGVNPWRRVLGAGALLWQLGRLFG